MSAPAAISPEETVSRLFRAYDTLDTEAIEAMFGSDAQGVDELSGGWRRGSESLREYLSMLKASELSDVRSETSDVHATALGDAAALVTLVLDQTYVFEGERQAIHAPTTIVLRREDDAWLVVLVHSVRCPRSSGPREPGRVARRDRRGDPRIAASTAARRRHAPSARPTSGRRVYALRCRSDADAAARAG
jgi:uncharacterized protein (TIGR02246 family)